MRIPTSAALLFLLLSPALPGAAPAAPPADVLRLAVVVSRHGVRAPLALRGADLRAYASQPWPKWEVPPGVLTPRGQAEMTRMGAYYRLLFAEEGLLTGRPDRDLPRVYFRADSEQRTVESARCLGLGLLPGGSPEIHALPAGAVDPLFRTAASPALHPDRALAVAAASGRFGGDPAALGAAIRPELTTFQRVFFGGQATPPGKISLLSLPQRIRAGKGDTLVIMDGPLHKAEYFAEYFLLEYEDGMPPEDVGWGRVDRATLIDLLRLHAYDWDLSCRTFYPAQMEGSNLASHLLSTLEQAAAGRPVPGAVGTPEDRLVFLVGHDSNLATLGGLLNLSWRVPEAQQNPTLPGSALVFELRQRRDTGAFFVRVYYVAETPDQVRVNQRLTLADPPATAPIFIPGCSRDVPGYDAPLAAFEALVRRVVNPQFVLPSAG